MPHVNLENLYQTALSHFPYELNFTSCAQGDLETTEDFIEYAEEHTFAAGNLLNEELVAGGWVELRQDSPEDEVMISAIFTLSRAGDWENGRILPETMAIQGQYELETKKWELWIDHI